MYFDEPPQQNVILKFKSVILKYIIKKPFMFRIHLARVRPNVRVWLSTVSLVTSPENFHLNISNCSEQNCIALEFFYKAFSVLYAITV